MITEAGWIIIINVISATIIAVVTLLTRRDVNSLKPQVMTANEKLTVANEHLAAANLMILSQGREISEMRDVIAMRKPTLTKDEFDRNFEASPPYRKPDK